jgi:hypothetical protein
LTAFRIDSSPATVVCAASNPHRRTPAASIHSHAATTAGLAAITTLVPTASALACATYRPSVNSTVRPPANTSAVFDPVNPLRYRTSGRCVTSNPSTPASFAAAAACLLRWQKVILLILPNTQLPGVTSLVCPVLTRYHGLCPASPLPQLHASPAAISS